MKKLKDSMRTENGELLTISSSSSFGSPPPVRKEGEWIPSADPKRGEIMAAHGEIVPLDQLIPLLDEVGERLGQWVEMGGNSRLGSAAVCKYLKNEYLKRGDVYPCTYEEIAEASRIWTKGRSEYSYGTFVNRLSLINQVIEMIYGNYDAQRTTIEANSSDTGKSGRKPRKVAHGVVQAREIGANMLRPAFLADHVCEDQARSISNPVYRFRYWSKPIPRLNFLAPKRLEAGAVGDLDLKDPDNVEPWSMTRYLEENTDKNEIIYISLYDGTYTFETVSRCLDKASHTPGWVLPKLVLLRIPSRIWEHLREVGLVTDVFQKEVLKKLERNIADIQDRLAAVGRKAEIVDWHKFPHYAGLIRKDFATFHEWGLDLESFPASIALLGPERYAERTEIEYQLFKSDIEDALKLQPGELFSVSPASDPKRTE